MAVEPVYQHPLDYELEVASQHLKDVTFWTDLVRREHPRRVLGQVLIAPPGPGILQLSREAFH